jgi:hypothetical protein
MEEGIAIAGGETKAELISLLRKKFSKPRQPQQMSSQDPQHAEVPAATEPAPSSHEKASTTSTTAPDSKDAQTSPSIEVPSAKDPYSSADVHKAPAMATAAPVSAEQDESERYRRSSLKQLLALAKEREIDVTGCVEKSDIIECLKLGKSAPQVTKKPNAAPVRKAESKLTAKASSTAKASTGNAGPSLPKAAPWRNSTTDAAEVSEKAKARATSGSSTGLFAEAKARARSNSSAGLFSKQEEDRFGESPSENGAWSERIRGFFARFPGFTAMLPPEAELWTNQDLEVYFGSDGTIWPHGKKPAWFQFTASGRRAEQANAPKPPPQPKTHPDLKQHFETLDLPETIEKDMIKRQYKRLALDCHPDKNPDDVEGSRKRFQEITAAYGAIKERLNL